MRTPRGRRRHLRAVGRWSGSLLLGVLLGVGSCGAGAEEPPASSTAPAAVLSADYRVGAGDRVQVSIWGEPSLTSDAPVMADGSLSLPLVGSLQVVGKTLPELTQAVREAYTRYLRDPKPAVSCIPRNPPQVYFEGAVHRPGPVPYDPSRRLSDYLGLAGGPLPGADLSRVVIASTSGEPRQAPREVDFSGATAARGENPVLQAGDTVWLGRALPVAVIGAVNRAGAIEYAQGLRLSDYVGLAGGPTDHAEMGKVVLQHQEAGKNVVRRIDLSAVLAKPGDAARNPILEPGDVVTIPESVVGGTLGWGDVLRALAAAVSGIW